MSSERHGKSVSTFRLERILMPEQYLLACPASPSPAVRANEAQYFTLVRQLLDDAIATGRTFDAIRTATLLAPWLYGQLRFREVSLVTCTLVWHSVSVGLDHDRYCCPVCSRAAMVKVIPLTHI